MPIPVAVPGSGGLAAGATEADGVAVPPILVLVSLAGIKLDRFNTSTSPAAFERRGADEHTRKLRS